MMFMCGIYGIAGKNRNPVERVLAGLERLEYRGYDSFGVGGRMQNGKRHSVFLERFIGAPSLVHSDERYRGRLDGLCKKVNGGSLVIGHTRWATHGGVAEKNAHPQCDTAGGVLVVLNGIIENYSELRSELEHEDGIVFSSDTDTEVIPQLIGCCMRKGKMSFQEAVLRTAQWLEGRFAFVAVEKNSDFVFCVRNGSPLVIGRSREESFVSSDPSAFGENIEEGYFLKNGEYARIGRSSTEIGCFKDGKSFFAVNCVFSQLGDIAETVTKEGYPHFMQKEIMEQKNALLRAMNQDEEIFLEAARSVRNAKRVYIVGCGTAANMSRIAEEWFSDIAGVTVTFVRASQFQSSYRFVDGESVVIAVSQSGETADVLEVAERCKDLGALLVSVVNTETSTLARMSDRVLPIKAGAEIGVAATKTAMCQLAVLYLLVAAVAGDVGRGRAILALVSRALENELTDEYFEEIKRISERFCRKEHMYVLGRGAMCPAAMEGALKIKEISYIHAEGFDAGEMKHGPIALVEEGTPIIALVPNDDTRTAMLNNLSEVRARGAAVIGISSSRDPLFDEWIPVADSGTATQIAALVPLQMLAYSLAVLRGKNPDKPRNLAKSVTVK